MKRTMKEIAEACHVSTSLVSRIINKDPTLKCRPETIDRVIKEIEKNDYIPNQNAKALAKSSMLSRRKITIGYVSYKGDNNLMNAFFNSIAEGVISILNEARCEVSGYYVDEIHEKYINKKTLSANRFDGIIIFGTLDDDLLKYLQSQCKYMSSIYGAFSPNYDFVGTDFNASLNSMLDLIKDYGYDEIGFVTGSDDSRNEAIKKYAKSIGLSFDNNFIFDGLNVTTASYNKMNELLKEHVPPKCICCMNDEMAIGVINALLDNNYSVPQDVSVTGHDDIMKASYCKVPVTTVRIFKEEIGRLITDLLLERIYYGRKFPVKVLVPCEIVIRDSLKKNEG